MNLRNFFLIAVLAFGVNMAYANDEDTLNSSESEQTTRAITLKRVTRNNWLPNSYLDWGLGPFDGNPGTNYRRFDQVNGNNNRRRPFQQPGRNTNIARRTATRYPRPEASRRRPVTSSGQFQLSLSQPGNQNCKKDKIIFI
jgi:hypothetical protein